MSPAVVSIDLGASFTKVAFRDECSPGIGRPFIHDARLIAIDGATLIPSLAIQTGNRKQPWLFGPDAADVRVGKDMIAYHNWKAGLFHRENDEAAAKASVVAHAFFAWLRPHVEAAVGFLDDKVVRIMLPAFTDFNKLARAIRECVRMAGWQPMELETATEPHANAIGLLTRGRNVATRGTRRAGPDFTLMFGTNNPYIERARAAVLRNAAARTMTIGIVDIGAFTTDVAVLDFDVVSPDAAGDGLTRVVQRSFEVGTFAHLDEPLWRFLGDKYGADFTTMTFRQREEIKRQLFSGESFAVLIGGKAKRIGGATDSEAMDRIATMFVHEIWSHAGEMIERVQPDAVYLTGGGASVSMVADKLARQCRNVLSVTAGATSVEAATSLLADWRLQPLERVATALGGASIIPPSGMDRVAPGVRENRAQYRAITNNGPTFRSCTCHGNPDCPRCRGTGYVSR